jgi:ABC-type polysaccharide transport system, permease component
MAKKMIDLEINRHFKYISDKSTGNSKLPRHRGGNMELLLMTVPALLLVFIFNYLPMYGIILAFKEYMPLKGILGSKWVGLKNFEFFFKSLDAWRITRNTIGLNLLFIITGLICSVAFALMMFEIKKRVPLKIYQTSALIPNFLSWVVVGYMTYAFLNPSLGILNNVFKMFNMDVISWYSQPEIWPGLLTVVNLWKGLGISSIVYFAGLMGIDKEYFEAAEIDGANKLQITFKITIPFLYSLMTILTILAIGGIFRSDFGLFYNIPRDVGTLYSTTDVIDTYVFRALKVAGDIGMSTAVGVYQSIVGFVLVMITNSVVNRINSENSLI